MTRDDLTDRQAEMFDLIVHSVKQRGYPPTLRELGEWMGIKSTNGVSDHLLALEKKGWIRRGRGARTIQLLP